MKFEEVLPALRKGKNIRCVGMDNTLKLKPKDLDVFFLLASDWLFSDNWEIVEEWYENITKPVICWVRDDDDDGWLLSQVINYKEKYDYPFETKYDHYKQAIPVKPEELLQQ